MNTPLRPKVYEFSKQRRNNSNWTVKSPTHVRTKTQLNMTKFKLSMIYEQEIANSTRSQIRPLKNVGIVTSGSKNGSKVAVCEIKEISAKPKLHNQSNLHKKIVKNQYFNKEKLNTLVNPLKKGLNLPNNDSARSNNSSLQGFLHEIWMRSARDKSIPTHSLCFTTKIGKALGKKSNSNQNSERIGLHKQSSQFFEEPCTGVYIQTDELNDAELIDME